jgi:hypothetical protein
MKVEHITLGGNAVIRDTNTISDAVKKALSGISGKSEKIWIKDLPFGIVITVTDEGAMFNIQKGNDIAILNVCCFDTQYNSTLIGLITKVNRFGFEIIDPVTPNWLYSIMINPFILSHTELSLCGEVELYIYKIIYDKGFA